MAAMKEPRPYNGNYEADYKPRSILVDNRRNPSYNNDDNINGDAYNSMPRQHYLPSTSSQYSVIQQPSPRGYQRSPSMPRSATMPFNNTDQAFMYENMESMKRHEMRSQNNHVNYGSQGTMNAGRNSTLSRPLSAHSRTSVPSMDVSYHSLPRKSAALSASKYEFHFFSIKRDENRGFGIDFAGGRDNPQISTREIFIVVADILPGVPAETVLRINDKVLSINGQSTEDVLNEEAVAMLRNSGQQALLRIAREKSSMTIPNLQTNNQTMITMDRRQTEDFGLRIDVKFVISAIKENSPASRIPMLSRNDAIVKINDAVLSDLTLMEVRHLLSRNLTVNLCIEKPDIAIPYTSQTSQPVDVVDRVYMQSSPEVMATPDISVPPRPPLPSDYRYSNMEDALPSPIAASGRRVARFTAGSNFGLKLSGGNMTGTFIQVVQNGSQADLQGLMQGDEIIFVAGIPVKGLTREEVVQLLKNQTQEFDVMVSSNREDFLRLPNNGSGDSYYIRSRIAYFAEDHGFLNIKKGDILKVVDTIPSKAAGSYFACTISSVNNRELDRGLIPNLARANQIQSTSSLKNVEKRPAGIFGSLRRSTRSRSRNRRASAGGNNLNLQYPAYEKVTFQELGFHRPIVLYGPIASHASQRLVDEDPNSFTHALSHLSLETGTIRVNDIKEAIAQGKHCLLDVSPNNVEWLNLIGLHPIVILFSPNSRHQIKEVMSQLKQPTKNTRKEFEAILEIERQYSHLITETLPLTANTIWFKNLCDTIRKHQSKNLWVRNESILNNDDIVNSQLPIASKNQFDTASLHSSVQQGSYAASESNFSTRISRTRSEPILDQRRITARSHESDRYIAKPHPYQPHRSGQEEESYNSANTGVILSEEELIAQNPKYFQHNNTRH